MEGMDSLKNFSQFGSAVIPATANIFIHIYKQRALLDYYIDFYNYRLPYNKPPHKYFG